MRLPDNLFKSLCRWAKKQEDEDTPYHHVLSIVLKRLSELRQSELEEVLAQVKTDADWRAALDPLGPPKDHEA